ncbi:MAG: DUF1553 domain-containing protein [Planctomycetota bacterium]|nr:MAG: DUF1553 domain-containing protein [Planctomycetota bacterium]REJ91578.1 MAG: DUF1553 domain-containing protein [Planctomycetota bacterium]
MRNRATYSPPRTRSLATCMGLAACVFVAALGSPSWAAEPAESQADASDDGTLSADKIHFFESEVRPLLVNRCSECHGEELQENGLRLDSRAALLKGGARGPAIVPGDATESLLMQAVRHVDEALSMPPEDDPVSEEAQIALARWINDGAVWPDDATSEVPSTPLERIDEIRREHWAFRPIDKPQPPTGDSGGWARNDVDRFIHARLEAAGFAPSPRAEPRTLVRRLYFDLLGIPPTYAEIEAFAVDPSQDAYAKLVDRLLARPEYGQRWGRHWLDVARYSDTKGYVEMNNYDPRYPFAWTYRDYVIRALNEDVPFDEFLLHQLAADQLELSDDEKWKLAGMGFLTVGRRFFNRKHRINSERIDLISRGLLGLSMKCAQCHDHKFDPVSMRDYYALYGVMDSSLEPGLPELPIVGSAPVANLERRKQYEAEMQKHEAARAKKLTELREKRAASEPATGEPATGEPATATAETPSPAQEDADAASRLTDDDYRSLAELHEEMERTALRYLDVAPPRAMTLLESHQPHDAAIHVRGDHRRPGKVAPRRFLEVLEHALGSRPLDRGSGRLQLARAIVDPANPLTARVMVNRVWGWHFGRGLVSTPSDFGLRGSPPSHPELLDYLARQFVDEGWSLKKLHRHIVTSATYQQSSAHRASCFEVDPLNTRLWRMNRRRLEFEPMRDAMLAAAGQLDTRLGGLPFLDINDPRRSVYYYINRRRIDETLPTFDATMAESTLAQRDRTTAPQQALYLMNSGFAMRRARALIARLDRADIAADTPTRVAQLYRWVYGRDPEVHEIDLARSFVDRSRADESPALPPLTARQRCWKYGIGEFDVEGQRLVSFREFPHFNGTRWQEGPDSPEMQATTAYFGRDGLRPGRDAQHALVLRFTPSTGAGQYLFKGQIRPGTNLRIGDGLDIYVLTSRDGLIKKFPVDRPDVFELRAEDVELGDGDHIDMIVVGRDSNQYDEFTMAPVVWKTERTAEGNLKGVTNWEGTEDFERAVPHWIEPLSPWEQYAQVLLISNEFMFVD